MPVYGGLQKLKGLKKSYKLDQGLDPETSGGLLIVMDHKIVREFQQRLKEDFGMDSWSIGKVVKGANKTILSQEVHFETI